MVWLSFICWCGRLVWIYGWDLFVLVISGELYVCFCGLGAGWFTFAVMPFVMLSVIVIGCGGLWLCLSLFLLLY